MVGSVPVSSPQTGPRLSFTALVRADLEEFARLKGTPTDSRFWLIDILTLPGAWSGMIWRAGTVLRQRGLTPLSRICYFMNIVLFGAELHTGAVIGAGLVAPHPVGLAIGSGTRFGERCRIMAKVSIGGSGHPGKEGHPQIGNDVWIFDSAKIFGPVTIGDRSIIGAGVIITRDVPPDSFVTSEATNRVRSLADVGLETHGGSLTPDRLASPAGP